MVIARSLLGICALLGCGFTAFAQDAAPSTQAGSGYVEREFRLPTPGSNPAGLDVLEVYVNTPGKHPLALLTHGTSSTPAERRKVTPWAQLSQAIWFARRGYVALVIIRRGYGTSGGKQDSTNGGCFVGSFEATGEAAADDLRGAVSYAEKYLPEVDTSTVVSAGVSTGGFTQVALAADPPAGLKAALDFAGGRGGDGKGDLCNEAGLLSAYKTFGKRVRTPMLWIYAENDKWFPPPFAHKFQTAFESTGGTDEFVLAPPDGDDGHQLFSHVGAWSATADTFLRAHRLLPFDPPLPGPTPPKVDPPAGLRERGIAAFKSYLILGPHKAFAVNGAGTYGYAAGMFDQRIADQHALENCNKNVHGGPGCTIVARGAG
jgi:dienelactone hydrolase